MIQPRLRVCLRSGLDEGLQREIGRGDKVVARELVSIHHRKADGVGLLVFHDLKDHLLVVNRVQVVPHDRCSKRLSPKRSDDEGVHVERCSCHWEFGSIAGSQYIWRKYLPFRSGGRSVTRMISINTIPWTPLPEPENWYARAAKDLRLKRASRRRRRRFSTISGFDRSSVSSEVSWSSRSSRSSAAGICSS